MNGTEDPRCAALKAIRESADNSTMDRMPIRRDFRMLLFVLLATCFCVIIALARDLGVVPAIVIAVAVVGGAAVIRIGRDADEGWSAVGASLGLLGIALAVQWEPHLDETARQYLLLGCWTAQRVTAGIGLVLLLRSRFPLLELQHVFDGVIASLALSALVLLIASHAAPAIREAHEPLAFTLAVIVSLGGMILFGLGLGAFSLSQLQPDAAWRALLAALGFGAIAGVLTSIGMLTDRSSMGWIEAAAFATSCIGFMVATLAPAHRHRRIDPHRWRSAALATFAVSLALLLQLSTLVGAIPQAHFGVRLLAFSAVVLALCKEGIKPFVAQNLAMWDERTLLGTSRQLERDIEREVGWMRDDERGPTLLLCRMHGLRELQCVLGKQLESELVERLAAALDRVGARHDSYVYRTDRDEFCLLTGLDGQPVDGLVAEMYDALHEVVAHTTVSAWFGSIGIEPPLTGEAAIRFARANMYEHRRERSYGWGDMPAWVEHDNTRDAGPATG